MAALRGVQLLQWTDHLAQDVGGDLSVQGRRFQFSCAEQYLIRRMSTFCSAGGWQKAWRRECIEMRFSMPASSAAAFDGTIELPGAQRPDRILAGEQPAAIEHLALCSCNSPPDAQAFQQHWRQHCVAILLALACSTRRVMRWLSMSPIFRATTSLTRSPVAYARARAVWCFRLPAAAIRRFTSSGLRITGSLRGRCTGCIFATNSGRSRVTLKKNFNPLIAELSEAGETPLSTRCNW